MLTLFWSNSNQALTTLGTLSLFFLLVLLTAIMGYAGYYRPVTRKSSQFNTDSIKRFSALGFGFSKVHGRTYCYGSYTGVPMMASWRFVQQGVALVPYVDLNAIVAGTSGMRLHAATELHGAGPSLLWQEAGDFMVSKGYKMEPERERAYLEKLSRGTRALLLDKTLFPNGISMLSKAITLFLGEKAALTVAGGDKDLASAIVVQQSIKFDVSDGELKSALDNLAKASSMMAKDWQ